MAIMAAALVMVLVMVEAGDPELTTDYPAPEGGAGPDSHYFTYRGMRTAAQTATANATAPGSVKTTRVTSESFGVLKGTGLSAAVLDFGPSSVLAPHTHPRAAELLFVVKGALHVGLVDSSGRYFNQTLHRGDIFVFPRGLLHYQANLNSSIPALAFSTFSSSNPGTLAIPNALFGVPIPTPLLAQAFRVPASVIDQLKAPFI